MTDERTLRAGFVAAAVAGVGFLLLSVETLLVGGAHDYRDVLWNIPGVCTLVAFGAVHAAQRTRTGRFERIAYWTTQTGLVAGMIGTNARAFDYEALAWLGFPLGALLWFVGLVMFGGAVRGAKVLPPYVGTAIAALEPASVVTGLAFSPLVGLSDHGAYSGALPKGVVLLLVARALSSLIDRGRPVPKGGGPWERAATFEAFPDQPNEVRPSSA